MVYHSLEEVEERINKNYACIKELENQIPLQETDEKKLELITFIGNMYSWYVTGTYSSNALEQQIIDIGRHIEFTPSFKPGKNQILIVMSKASAIGGHTCLVHNWLKWDSERQYSIAFTDMNGSMPPDFIEEAVRESGGELFFLSGTNVGKAKKLLEISQKFCRILLFTHMEDVVPVLAYSNKNWTVPVYFYNHADWRFSFGFSVSDIVLNLFLFDIDKAVRYRGIPRESCAYLQFPGIGVVVKEAAERTAPKDIRQWIFEKYQVAKTEKLIVSMGYGYRYQSIIGYEFDAYVRDVMRKSGYQCSFLIIGPNSEDAKWRQLERDTKGKARALGLLPYEEVEWLISGADLYIVSFPQLSSGESVAAKAGVPYLFLDIIGRCGGGENLHSAASVQEMTQKTLDVLLGNKHQYQAEQDDSACSQVEWKKAWEEIFARVTEHSAHAFYPQRRIEKQEQVYCQLLQEEAVSNIAAYLRAFSLDKPVMEELFRLDRKYDMGLIWQYARFLNGQLTQYAKLSDKHLRLYKTAVEWIKVKQMGLSIGRYLHSQGYGTAAIYGMGYMGRRLLEELSGGPVKVLYGIDKQAESLNCAIRIFLPSEELEPVDVIMNTTAAVNSEIQALLTFKNPARMLCLDEIFESLEKMAV